MEAFKNRTFTYTDHAPLSSLPIYTVPSNIPKSSTVHAEGIFHGLPEYSPSTTPQTAIVAGANGISGTYMLRTMSQHPKLWKRVHGISRRPPSAKYPDHFTSHSIDLYGSPQEIAKRFEEEGIEEVDAIFYYVAAAHKAVDKKRPYGQAQLMAEENGQLFDHFLQAILIAGLKPKRILLQTGGKGYGQHWGPYVSPSIEDDIPRARFYKEPNFYYSLEDLLWHFCKTQNVEWCESRPSYICGSVKDNYLNFFTPLLIYGAVSKWMGKTELVFPGDRAGWNMMCDMTSAAHMSYFQQWQMLAPQAGNQIFHTTDGSHFGWARLFPLVASFFGLKAPPPPADDDRNVQWSSYAAQQESAIGYPGVVAVCKYQFMLADWQQKPEIRKAWTEMADAQGLDVTLQSNDFMWSVLDRAINNWWPLNMSMAKARKFGYYGTCDSIESLKVVAQDAVDLKIIPEVDTETFQW